MINPPFASAISGAHSAQNDAQKQATAAINAAETIRHLSELLDYMRHEPTAVRVISAALALFEGTIAWPPDAKFKFGQPVHCPPPAPYRFPGIVRGWYRRADNTLGYCVSREGDPGNIEIFGERRLVATGEPRKFEYTT